MASQTDAVHLGQSGSGCLEATEEPGREQDEKGTEGDSTKDVMKIEKDNKRYMEADKCLQALRDVHNAAAMASSQSIPVDHHYLFDYIFFELNLAIEHWSVSRYDSETQLKNIQGIPSNSDHSMQKFPTEQQYLVLINYFRSIQDAHEAAKMVSSNAPTQPPGLSMYFQWLKERHAFHLTPEAKKIWRCRLEPLPIERPEALPLAQLEEIIRQKYSQSIGRAHDAASVMVYDLIDELPPPGIQDYCTDFSRIESPSLIWNTREANTRESEIDAETREEKIKDYSKSIKSAHKAAAIIAKELISITPMPTIETYLRQYRLCSKQSQCTLDTAESYAKDSLKSRDAGSTLHKHKRFTEASPSHRSTYKRAPIDMDPNSSQKAIRSARERINLFTLERGIPGLTICVSKRGQIIWHEGFGYSDVENQVACRSDARMRIASISKSLFSAVVVGPLIDQDKIDLKKSIHDVIKEDEFPRKKFGDKDVDITIQQLLAHTSGILHYDEKTPDDPSALRPIGSEGSMKIYQNDDQYSKKGFYQRATFRSVIEALEPFKNEPLLHEPGSKFSYTTYGYTLLSAALERICEQLESCCESGESKKVKKFHVEHYWMNKLRREWKMEDTCLDQEEPILPYKARYYLRSGINGQLINAPYADNSVKWAGGGLISTTRDLVKFGNALINSYKGREGARLKSDTVKTLWKVEKEDYGLGFASSKVDPEESGGDELGIHHAGGALGASSILVIYPESEIVVAILCNLGEVKDLKKIGYTLASQFAK